MRADWVEGHDGPWMDRERDRLADETDYEDMLEVAREIRFNLRWAPKRCHLLTFTLDTAERPRLLASRNAKANYVEHPAQALSHEPEAVDAATQKLYAREGHQGWAARELAREADRERLGLEERMRVARLEARAAGVDVTMHEAAFLKRIRALERATHQRSR